MSTASSLSRLALGAPMALVAMILGCGASGPAQAMSRTRDPGDPVAAPSMRTLPGLDIARRDLTQRMKFAWTLAEQSFQLPPPPPPGGRPDSAEIERWTSGDLRDWLERKDQLVEAARQELNAAADQNRRQRIMAGAIVGLMYEDIGRVLLTVPTPRDIEDDAEIAPLFQTVVEGRARPFVNFASVAYRACRENARDYAPLSHWAGYCETRRAGLPTAEAPAPPSGETRVTVTRE